VRIAAHHAFAAEYDENRRVAVSGTVTGSGDQLHVWLYIDGKDKTARSPDGISRWVAPVV
jgi:hypothetical protein